MFIQERGIDAARYCATCHNPIGLISGEVAFDAVIPSESARGSDDSKSELSLINVGFNANYATTIGGGIMAEESSLFLINATAHANGAGFRGGGLYTLDPEPSTFTNLVLWGNHAGENSVEENDVGPAQLYVSPGGQNRIQISHSLIQGSGGSGAEWASTRVTVQPLPPVECPPLKL